MYDSIVIGGGIVGSSAAYSLSKDGKHTLLLDQFHLPTSRGSSHGPGRVYRSSYSNQLYTKMSMDSFELWKQLERETNTTLYIQTGMLVSDKPPFRYLKECVKTNTALGVKFDILRSEEIHKRYPGLARVPKTHKAFLETGAGLLKADKALECLRTQIKKFGGQINDGEKVLHIFPGSIVTVKTDQNTYKTKSLIIAAGPWTCKLMKPLGLDIPVRVERVTIFYWKEKFSGQSKRYPIYCDYGIDIPDHFIEPAFVYVFPSLEYHGLRKMGIHQGFIVDPDCRDGIDDRQTTQVQYLLQYIKQNYPELEEQPAVVENCMYSITPDNDFIIDYLPGHPNIVFGCGFSGHGFKMAPVTGRVLGEMALGEEVSYNVSSLSMKRFELPSKY